MLKIIVKSNFVIVLHHFNCINWIYYFLDQPSNHKPFGAQNSYKFYQNQFDESYDDEIYSDKEYDYCTEDEYNTIFDYYD